MVFFTVVFLVLLLLMMLVLVLWSWQCMHGGGSVGAGTRSIQDLMAALKQSAQRFRQVMGPACQRWPPPTTLPGASRPLLPHITLTVRAPAPRHACCLLHAVTIDNVCKGCYTCSCSSSSKPLMSCGILGGLQVPCFTDQHLT